MILWMTDCEQYNLMENSRGRAACMLCIAPTALANSYQQHAAHASPESLTERQDATVDTILDSAPQAFLQLHPYIVTVAEPR